MSLPLINDGVLHTRRFQFVANVVEQPLQQSSQTGERVRSIGLPFQRLDGWNGYDLRPRISKNLKPCIRTSNITNNDSERCWHVKKVDSVKGTRCYDCLDKCFALSSQLTPRWTLGEKIKMDEMRTLFALVVEAPPI